MSKKIVIALGGNALGNNLKEQQEALTHTSSIIVDLIEEGHQVIITHGNGPQVGKIHQLVNQNTDEVIPLYVSVAMSQGYIGFDLSRKISAELAKRKIDKKVDYLLSQVVVDGKDPAFEHPTKPIGAFVDETTSKQLESQGYSMIEDSGRGYRRVVPSPIPQHVIELESIISLSNEGHVVICTGGGGISVVESDSGYQGVEAVIDKDRASALLAKEVDADILFILTAVEKVAINFGKVNQKWLSTMSIEETYQYIEEGHFAPGSMLPKVEAALAFVEAGKGKKTIISLLDKAKEALDGKTGTVIVSE